MGDGMNHMTGYWGGVSGADFCEYNYDTTFYVGELVSTLTALLTFFALGLAYTYASRRLFPLRIPMTLEMMLMMRAINLGFAASQHATLNNVASNGQEATLAIGIWFMVYLFVVWGEPNEIPFVAVLIWGLTVGSLQMFTVLHVTLPWGLQAIPWSPIVSICALCYISFVARSTSTKFLVLSSSLFVVAEIFFTITAVQNGLCDRLHGFQLHSVGHIFGCGSEWCTAMWCFALKLEFDGQLVDMTWSKGIPYVTIQSDDSESKSISPMIAKGAGNYRTFERTAAV